ncbi:MAG: RHS repeat-associated core domain-containing protein, partial [Candidatus Nitrotoga sp.]
RARYFDPVLKRFISADPIGLGGGVNRYTYVGGNPISRVDPDGRFFFVAAFGRSAVTAKADFVAVAASSWWASQTWMSSNAPPGAIDAVRGAKEWGRKNGVDDAVDIFHDIKRGNRGKPGSKAADNCSVNPDTGDVYDGQGDHIGNLDEGH